MVKSRHQNASKHRLAHQLRFRIVVSIATIIVTIGLLKLFGVINIYPSSSKTVTGGQSTKGEAINSRTNNPEGSNTSVASANDSTNVSESTNNGNGAINIIPPSGDFVSDHHPNLSGSPAPNTMSSVCTTSPSATCEITFTMGNITKSLPAQTTDSNGSTYWSWKLQDIGLTTGTWQVQATGTLDGQTKTSIDAMDLVVSP